MGVVLSLQCEEGKGEGGLLDGWDGWTGGWHVGSCCSCSEGAKAAAGRTAAEELRPGLGQSVEEQQHAHKQHGVLLEGVLLRQGRRCALLSGRLR